MTPRRPPSMQELRLTQRWRRGRGIAINHEALRTSLRLSPWFTYLRLHNEREIPMKPNSEARARLRQQFNNQLNVCRECRKLANNLIDRGRTILNHDATVDDEARQPGLDLINEGVKAREGGSRELTLALAFCNNTPYLACEGNALGSMVVRPSRTELEYLLAGCFPTVPCPDLRDYVARWLDTGDLKPKAIFPEVKDRPEVTIDKAPAFELLDACR